MDLEKFMIQFQDYLAPKLDTYEQAIYLYVFRHSRLIGKEETVICYCHMKLPGWYQLQKKNESFHWKKWIFLMTLPIAN